MAKKKCKLIIYILMCLILFTFGIYLFKMCGSNKTTYNLNYKETNKIDYLVYLKDNDFYEERYLEKGRTYITSLIDYISVNMYYNTKFEEIVDGKYSYKIIATVYANKSDGSGNYWQKDFEIKTVDDTDFTSADGFSIMENVPIDYDYYNDIYAEFKNDANMRNVAMDGVLKINLSVSAKVNDTEGNFENKEISSSNIMTIPLSQSAIDASISTDDKEVSKTLSTVVVDNNIRYLSYKILSASCLTMGIVMIYLIIDLINKIKKYHFFDYSLNKILSNYDSIIVNVKGKFESNGLNVIRVNSFEELLDAHSEVRMPINYYEVEKDRKYEFVLINDGNAWVYAMDSNNFRGNYEK